jgi:AbrB family looped-hinge helix DNA binding protein
MKNTTKLSTKGQIVLPKTLRTERRWKPGTEFTVQEREDGVLLRPTRRRQPGDWKRLIGCAGYSGSRKSIRQMDAAVADAIHGSTK